ncbi:alpha-1,2-fucosyltransferase [Candidatus Roizmanbacteria bacterium]|nr:alpha-1,2-fucosyltransferase [Candidatus Roizmanbacteria bacterium]
MIITNLTGGLGNQMFQYALGRHLALKNKTKLKLHFTNALFNTKRDYELSIFDIKATLATREDLNKMGVMENRIVNRLLYLIEDRLSIKLNKKIVTERPPYRFNHSVLSLTDNIYLQGYWQDENYFKDIENIIRKDFTFTNPLDEKNRQIVDLIKKTDSVSIHVRRGDYVSNPLTKAKLGVLPFGYYKKSIDKIKKMVKKPVFFVFSDDIPWCRHNLKIGDNVYFIDHNKGIYSYRDMQLMSLCRHNIIANSTFSWWAGWLNDDKRKIIIKPK